MNNECFDKALWFQTEGHCEGEHYMVGNGHTFHGRMYAYCPKQDVYFRVSLSEITDMSTETSYWIKGFLSGNEPRPPVDEEGHLLSREDNAYQTWEESVRLFQKTGYWHPDERVCTECGEDLLYAWEESECEDCYPKNKGEARNEKKEDIDAICLELIESGIREHVIDGLVGLSLDGEHVERIEQILLA